MQRHARSENRRKMLAGARMDLAQEILLFEPAVPALEDAHDRAVLQAEAANIDGVGEGMLGEARATLVVHRSAGVGAHRSELDHRLAEAGHRRRLHHLLEPAVDGGIHRAGERAFLVELGQQRARPWREEARRNDRARLLGLGESGVADGEGRHLDRMVRAAAARPLERPRDLNELRFLDDAGADAGGLGLGAPLRPLLADIARAPDDREADGRKSGKGRENLTPHDAAVFAAKM